MNKFELEVTEADIVKPKTLADRIVKNLDIRPNAEYREAAQKMEVGDSIPDLDGKTADRLYRAIEEVHGPRTATMRQRPAGSVKHTVWRVAARPERKRKGKANA